MKNIFLKGNILGYTYLYKFSLNSPIASGVWFENWFSMYMQGCQLRIWAQIFLYLSRILETQKCIYSYFLKLFLYFRTFQGWQPWCIYIYITVHSSHSTAACVHVQNADTVCTLPWVKSWKVSRTSILQVCGFFAQNFKSRIYYIRKWINRHVI